MLKVFFTNASYLVPELVIVFGLGALTFFETTYRRGQKKPLLNFISYGFLILTLGFLAISLKDAKTFVFAGSMVVDTLSSVFKVFMVLSSLGVIFINQISNDIEDDIKPEFNILVFALLSGGMVLASANNLLMIYLGIETLSIISYAVATFKRKDSLSAEAGLKYVLYGGVTAGVMLFGLAHIYGITGSIQLEGISSFLSSQEAGETKNMVFLIVSILLFFVGIGYKIAVFPFHMWSPDVYQGSPLPSVAFFGLIPKFAGLAVLLRVSHALFAKEGPFQDFWLYLIQVVSILTMFVGNLSAIGQDSLKRFLAFSSIGHVGFMLLGVLLLNNQGTGAILFYALAYLVMTLILFIFLSSMSRFWGTDSKSTLKGLIKTHPLVAVILCITLFSLAGIPPLSGFVAKFQVIFGIVEKKFIVLAIIATVNSVISLYYYLEIIKNIIFGEPADSSQKKIFTLKEMIVLVFLLIPVFIQGLFWNGIIEKLHF